MRTLCKGFSISPVPPIMNSPAGIRANSNRTPCVVRMVRPVCLSEVHSAWLRFSWRTGGERRYAAGVGSGQNDPKSGVRPAEVLHAARAVGKGKLPSRAGPGPASQHVAPGELRQEWVIHPRAAVGRHAVVIWAPDVETPFAGVALHVVQSPGIGLLGADGLRAGGILFVPCRITRTSRGVVLTARAGGVFPLGLGRQANGPAGLLAQPPAKRHRIAATDDDGRMVVRRFEAGATPVEVALMRMQAGQRTSVGPASLLGVRLVPGSLHERAELADRDFGPADAEVVIDIHLMNRPLVAVARRRAHKEPARGDAHRARMRHHRP